MNETTESQPSSADRPGIPYARFTRRVHALSLDALLYLGAVILMILGAPLFASSAVGQRLFFASFVGFMLLYEPVLVTRLGGTLGHGWANLRVVSNRSGANLSFLRALARALVKWLLGWLSFVGMTFTRRHQAIHDLVTDSHVRVRDLSSAESHHYAAERPPVHVGILRRVAIIAAYNVLLVALLVGLMAVTEGLISADCWDNDVCTTAESLFFAMVTLVWLALVIVTIALGWRGLLPGARRPAA
ncbi:MAG TPA: RDD family protein [Longimicrobiales bacterium]|nr:RDD family protein [Longimicrobiales bacterium]